MMEQRAQVLAQIAATLAIGQMVEHHMTAAEAQRLVENAELLLRAAEIAEEAHSSETGRAHQQALERFSGHET